MPAPGSGFWLELSHIGKLVTQAGFVAAILAALVLAAISAWRLARPRLRPLRAWLRWQAHHRAAHRFALDVAAGHLDDADGAVARVLGGLGGLERGAQHRTLAGWDERVVLTGPGSGDAGTDSPDPGWPWAIHQPAPADFVVGRCRPIRLRLLSWRRAGTDGVRFVVDAQGTVLAGHLLARPAPAGTHGVELWVHLEGPPTRRGRRALRVTRRATRSRLHAWAAHHRRSRAHHRRRRARDSRHGNQA